MTKIIVHAAIVAKPEHFDELKKALSDIRDVAVNQEQGTLVYRVSVNNSNPHKIEVFEEYADQAAFDAHKNNAPFQALIGKAKDWLAEPVVISESTEF